MKKYVKASENVDINNLSDDEAYDIAVAVVQAALSDLDFSWGMFLKDTDYAYLQDDIKSMSGDDPRYKQIDDYVWKMVSDFDSRIKFRM